jgi:hypothetical protein
MSGMLPIQDYSQAVTQHREREMRDQVERRSVEAAARTSAVDRVDEPGEARPRLIRSDIARHLQLRHHGPAVRT